MNVSDHAAPALRDRVSPSALERDKIAKAYSDSPWWYDIRGFLILKFSYRNSLLSQVRFFEKNIRETHLEVAVGTGTLLKMVLWFHALRGGPLPSVLGIDYSDTMLSGAKSRFAGSPNIELRQGDIGKLSHPEGSFRSVNIANAFHCFTDPDGALRSVHRVLASKGRLAANVLLHPRGTSLLRRTAERINAWGIEKGLLVTPYRVSEVRAKLVSTGFELREERVSGNCYAFVAEKP